MFRLDERLIGTLLWIRIQKRWYGLYPESCCFDACKKHVYNNDGSLCTCRMLCVGGGGGGQEIRLFTTRAYPLYASVKCWHNRNAPYIVPGGWCIIREIY